MRTIRRLILHCTDSDWGSIESVRKFHVDVRGWKDVGYHFLLTNAFPTFDSLHDRTPDPTNDGLQWAGRSLEEVGAHALGHNEDSIGVALVGRGGVFTGLQISAAVALCAELAITHEFPVAAILGHYETGAKKTCPDLNMEWFRELVRRRLS